MMRFATTDVRMMGLDRAAALAGGALACEAGHEAERPAANRWMSAQVLGSGVALALVGVALAVIL